VVGPKEGIGLRTRLAVHGPVWSRRSPRPPPSRDTPRAPPAPSCQRAAGFEPAGAAARDRRGGCRATRRFAAGPPPLPRPHSRRGRSLPGRAAGPRPGAAARAQTPPAAQVEARAAQPARAPRAPVRAPAGARGLPRAAVGSRLFQPQAAVMIGRACPLCPTVRCRGGSRWSFEARAAAASDAEAGMEAAAPDPRGRARTGRANKNGGSEAFMGAPGRIEKARGCSILHQCAAKKGFKENDRRNSGGSGAQRPQKN